MAATKGATPLASIKDTKSLPRVKPRLPSRYHRVPSTSSLPKKQAQNRHSKASLNQSSIITPTLKPCVEAELDDLFFVFPDDFEEIANLGSDTDLVPFDEMEFPEMNAYARVHIVDHDPTTPSKEMQDHKVEEEVEASKQQGEDHSVGTSYQETKNEAVRPEQVSAVEKRKHQQGGKDKWKKDLPVYNDVIEETASKLLEKRKNKVRALVGAFETVISLQD